MRKSAAFTLIEFLVVIAIIACLLFPVKRKQAKKSRITACASLRSYLCRRGLCSPGPPAETPFYSDRITRRYSHHRHSGPNVAAGSGEFKQLPFELRRTQYVELLLHRDG